MANLGYVQITRYCNQNCRFCSNPPREAELTLERGRALLDDLVARGYHGAIFTGGEPTLVPFLTELVAHARSIGLPSRLITNGQRLGSGPLLGELVAAGLEHLHVSLHSVRPDLQAFLTRTPDSHANLMATLERAGQLADRLSTDVNCVINHFNAGELDVNVRFLLERFPFVRHYVWNNLDPRMSRVAENPDTIPRLCEFELSLARAMRLLEAAGRTFRVERVPLCYMVEYAHCSTETRKIVKSEERVVHFLDEKGTVRQAVFEHPKADCCRACRLDPICAGLDGLGAHYDGGELYPVFVDPDVVRRRVRREAAGPAADPPPRADL